MLWQLLVKRRLIYLLLTFLAIKQSYIGIYAVAYAVLLEFTDAVSELQIPRTLKLNPTLIRLSACFCCLFSWHIPSIHLCWFVISKFKETNYRLQHTLI
jgi:hypothetical protein